MKQKRRQIDTGVCIASILVFVSILIFKGASGYWRDASVAILIASLIYWKIPNLRLSSPGFIGICAVLLIHTFGGLGLYANPPFGIPYDIITHFFGFVAVAYALSDVLSPHLPRKYHIIVILLASLGIGSLVENLEYMGYLVFGKGEGFFAFGAGDVNGDFDLQDSLLTVVGGGYFDAMGDLLVNLLGSLCGIGLWLVRRRLSKS